MTLEAFVVYSEERFREYFKSNVRETWRVKEVGVFSTEIKMGENMIALKIEDMKQFTASLFLGEVFDSFLLKEAEIVTFNMFTIDGRVRHGYYSEEELEEHQIEEYSAWFAVKPFCFSLIKGKKLPESFHIVLQLSPKSTKSFLDKNKIPVAAEQVQGLYLNIRYEETKIQCVTGTSLSFFTLDKTMDQEWDKAVCQFFKVHKIPFSQM